MDTLLFGEWKEYTDPTTSRKFYFNVKTSESRWTLEDITPPSTSSPISATPTAVNTQDVFLKRTNSTPEAQMKRMSSPSPAPAQTTPPVQSLAHVESKWKEFFDSTHNRTYYFNVETQETRWERPLEMMQSPEISPAPLSPPSASLSLPATPLSSSMLEAEKQSASSNSTPATTITPSKVPSLDLPATKTAGDLTTNSLSSPDLLMSARHRNTLNVSTLSSSPPSPAYLPNFLPSSSPKTLTQYAASTFPKRKKKSLFSKSPSPASRVVFSKDKLKEPLHVYNTTSYATKSLESFELIQIYMGDYKKSTNPAVVAMAAKPAWEVAKELLQLGLLYAPIRNEIIVQICKQVNQHPKPENATKGLQLLCLFLTSFPPNSFDCAEAVLNFLQSLTKTNTWAQLAEKKLRLIMQTGPRKSIPSDREIQSADKPIQYEPVFGVSINEYYTWQLKKYPGESEPVVLKVLAQALANLKGHETEGIFRKPGSSREVEHLREKLMLGNFSVAPDDTRDPNVVASVFKLWLRELQDPIIPYEMYTTCLDASNDAELCVKIVNEQLPEPNRSILLYVLRFLSDLTKHSAATMMNIDNLATVFSPNILRNTSSDPLTVMRNSPMEQQFMKNVLRQMAK